jgi:hypothetical protein
VEGFCGSGRTAPLARCGIRNTGKNVGAPKAATGWKGTMAYEFLYVLLVSPQTVQKILAYALSGSHQSPHALRNLLSARRAIAAGAWSGIAKTELTLISHKT